MQNHTRTDLILAIRPYATSISRTYTCHPYLSCNGPPAEQYGSSASAAFTTSAPFNRQAEFITTCKKMAMHSVPIAKVSLCIFGKTSNPQHISQVVRAVVHRARTIKCHHLSIGTAQLINVSMLRLRVRTWLAAGKATHASKYGRHSSPQFPSRTQG